MSAPATFTAHRAAVDRAARVALAPALHRVHGVAANDTPAAPQGDRALYEALMQANASTAGEPALHAAAKERIEAWLATTADSACDLPEDPEQLSAWMSRNVEATGQRYQAYLARRKAGGAREYFATRSAALCFLRTVAPTKLVDGAWLYGLLPHWRNPRFTDLVHTYVEELGDGAADKNHVLLYRQLLQSHGIDDWAAQPDDHYVQGALQLALASCSEDFTPEVIGFNLGYEQLPLHLLVTAYELNELGIDPYYFTLHVTVDNAASGHAQRAVKAVLGAVPQLEGKDVFWHRVRHGYRLNDVGLSTNGAIAAFDLHAEFLRVLSAKTTEGRVAHSDYCRIEGRTVNEWLADAQGAAAFVGALERKGWLKRGDDPAQSRFWQLLRGERADMFGVFSEYELQVIYDWIRGDAAADGARVPALDDATPPHSPRSFRHQQRALRVDIGPGGTRPDEDAFDPDASALTRRLAVSDDPAARLQVVVEMMGPAQHWRVAGLHATRLFADQLLHARGG